VRLIINNKVKKAIKEIESKLIEKSKIKYNTFIEVEFNGEIAKIDTALTSEEIKEIFGKARTL